MRVFKLGSCLALIAGLSACGEAAPSQPSAPALPPLSEAERSLMLSALPVPLNAANLDNGRAAFARCRSCHTLTPGGPNMTGPNLYKIIGRPAGSHPGFNYSNALKTAGFSWDSDQIDNWLQNPRTFLKGNKMAFAGIPDADDRRDVIAYLSVETAERMPAP